MKCQFCQRTQKQYCCLWYQYFYHTKSTDWDSPDYKRFLNRNGVDVI